MLLLVLGALVAAAVSQDFNLTTALEMVRLLFCYFFFGLFR